MKVELRSLNVAALATALVLAWQIATVHANYDGNWTALYCVGRRSILPDELKEGVWIHEDSKGYDGQWYRIVARDPWLQDGLWRYLDTPKRQQRILLPAVAWALAAGHPKLDDTTFIATALCFLFAGVWISAVWIADQGKSLW